MLIDLLKDHGLWAFLIVLFGYILLNLLNMFKDFLQNISFEGVFEIKLQNKRKDSEKDKAV